MNKRIYIVWLLAISFWLLAEKAFGAAITTADLPYLCDFEDETENANWKLNPGVEGIITENRWVIGDALAYTGRKSMYVSGDGGVSSEYAATNNMLLAYRDITLDQGDYDIAYDWNGTGYRDGKKLKGYLKVLLVNRAEGDLSCAGNNSEPQWVSTAKLQLMGEDTVLVDGDTWYHVQTRFTITRAYANKPNTRLLFVWINTDVTVKDSITSIAIDNLQLAKASQNGYPENIHVTTSLGTSTVSWEGQADEYEVLYRKKTDNEFTSIPADGNSVTMPNVEYGAYEFWICSINGEEKTIYSVFPTVYLYETDCFDALNMYNAEFEYGTWKYLRTQGIQKEIKGTKRVDYGPGDIRSRHTTHFDTTEIDPRTIVKQGLDTIAYLKTIPNNQYGSVRLGNWNSGYEYESITFHYTVESQSMAVLLIHYAMVLENPDHQAEEQPRFTLEVLNEAGDSIDTKCANVDFHAPSPKEWEDPEVQALWHVSKWEETKNGKGTTSHTVNWQDWKTIGISMEDYVGQTLTIRLTTYDCAQGGHFGYAYFTLSCERSDVDGLPWGEGSTTRMFTAPEGFDYAWFNRDDVLFTDTLSKDRFFYVQESDTNTYMCHVTYPTNKECGYWFDASAKPHNPKAEMELQWEPKDCQNGYRWWNRCHVMLTNQETGEIEDRYDKHLESCFLIMEDGTEQPVGYVDEGTLVPMPDEGGILHYGIRTGIYVNDKLYADTAWYEFEIPAIGPIETNLFDSICRGEEVFFPMDSISKRTEPGIYYDSLISEVTGCDSVVLFHLHVHEPKLAMVYDTLCMGGKYTFGNRTITTAGIYTGLFVSQETGCDSIATLHLYQAPSPKVSIRERQLCADWPVIFAVENSLYVDSMHIHVEGTRDTTEWLRRGDADVVVKLENKDVGYHNAIVYFYQPWCETVWTDTLTFGITLASENLIELHWDDMLTFLAPDINGGLTFTSYQWYQEGLAIEGATKSYYYDPNMQSDTEYTVCVTTEDGVELWVCPFTPADVDPRRQGLEFTETGTPARKVIRNGQLLIITNGHTYTAQGQLIQ